MRGGRRERKKRAKTDEIERKKNYGEIRSWEIWKQRERKDGEAL
jgi:hypothetical protein